MASIIVEAIYENGILRPAQPLPFSERERVTIAVSSGAPDEVLGEVLGERSYGILGWTGDSATVQRIALDPEFGLSESP